MCGRVCVLAFCGPWALPYAGYCLIWSSLIECFYLGGNSSFGGGLRAYEAGWRMKLRTVVLKRLQRVAGWRNVDPGRATQIKRLRLHRGPLVGQRRVKALRWVKIYLQADEIEAIRRGAPDRADPAGLGGFVLRSDSKLNRVRNKRWLKTKNPTKSRGTWPT